MKPARDWAQELALLPPDATVERIQGRGGADTLRVDDALLHSRYNPAEEARRLVDAAGLSPERPVLVLGMGLGYHVRELLDRGFKVAVLEPSFGVAKAAFDAGAADLDCLLAIGGPDALEGEAFQAFVRTPPQLFVHPPTARLHPGFAEAAAAQAAKLSLAKRHLNIAIVGPLYGGSLPITDYLTRSFQKLGHHTLQVDNRVAWDLYRESTEGIKDQHASGQLGQMLTQFLSEWCYARVAEFKPEICIVLAQAPVLPQFPARLAKLGIVTAYWFVENWRHMDYWKTLCPLYDCFFHIQPGEFEGMLDTAGCRHHAFVQTGCEPDLHRPVTLSKADQKDYGCALSFAGAGYNNRRQVFKGLTDYDLKLWGVNWPDRELAGRVVDGERRFDNDTFMKIVAGSKINLNLHASTAADGVDTLADAINPRVFEIAAAGGFQLCDPCAGLDQHFDFDSELPVYHNLQELRERIGYFLDHPEERAEFAKRAQERAVRDHSYERRAEQMLDFILEHHGATILRRGVRVQRTVGEVLEALDPDSELGAWLKTLPPDVLFTQEGVNAFVRPGRAQPTPAEKVFHYLHEVREFAETMLSLGR